MISEFDEMEISFLDQAKDLKVYKELIGSLNDDMVANELEMLEWAIRGCIPDNEKPLMTLKDIVLAEITNRGVKNDNN